ncbi:RadC family protein [Oceanomicrobium pacificus]|uniref:DNA repair protein RadC n=1 Tax=Oceanomicrobium pacificus TaxID=2692916 RepID=A0A6B0U0X2_9RHOB|nr:DNA repair protein RadC [Oceanomicrobium pacificus]MXU64771.1 DNA repair protein RadC [Oceanomicrobium pacificus]
MARSGSGSDRTDPPLPGLSDTGAAGSFASDPQMHQQHRERLRAKLMRAGPEALADYELLELVLFRAIPRRDVKPLAKVLMGRFGNFNHVMSAPVRQLERVPGVGPAVIRELKIVEATAHRFAQAGILGQEVLSSWDAVVAYCRARMAHLPTEEFRILFLDRQNVLIADEAQQKGSVDHVPVYPREVAKRALELNASALLLVHNHPSGDPRPSQADIKMTRQVEQALSALGITLHDHLIVGKAGATSLRSLGHI